MPRDAYARFGHPAVTPLVQIGPQPLDARAVPRADAGLQGRGHAAAGAADGPRAGRARRSAATIVGATSGDTGGAAIEAFRGSHARRRRRSCFPKGRVSDVQRRMMTTPTEANVHAIAIEGTFDDCQALVKAHVQRPRPSATACQLAGVNSINWARIVGAGDLLLRRRRRARRAAPAGVVRRCRPATSATSSPATCAKRMGLPIERLVIATNVNDILPRTLHGGIYEMREVVATTSPSMDIQISSNFERYLFEASGRDAAVVRAKMGGLTRNRQLRSRRARRHHAARVSRPPRASEADVADCIRAHARPRAATCSTRTPPAASSPPTETLGRRPHARRSCWRPRTRPSSPTPCRRSPASARRCRRASPAC